MAVEHRTQPDVAKTVPDLLPQVRDRSQLISGWCPRQDSNLRSRLRRAVLYPLSYGGMPIIETPSQSLPHRPARALRSGAQLGGGSGCAPRWVISWARYSLSAPCEMTIFSARLRTWAVSACCAV